MSELKLPTRYLVGLLTDARRTAGKDKEVPHLMAVLLHTQKGEWEVPPGDEDDDERVEALIESVPSELLVATSAGRSHIGQGHTWCEGGFHRPVLLAAVDVDAIIDLFKPLIKSLGKTTHRTVLRLEGSTLILSEDPDQVRSDKSLHVVPLGVENYPKGLPGLLAPDPTAPVVKDGKPVERSYGMGLAADDLSIIASIGKRRKEVIAVYAYHQSKGIVVCVGRHWRGLFMPTPLEEKTGQYLNPLVEVFDTPLPAAKEEEEQTAIAV